MTNRRAKKKTYVPAEGPLLRRARELTWKQIMAIMIVVLGVIIAAAGLAEMGQRQPDATVLAACLTARGWAVYGSPACGACIRQKELFGDAWQHIWFVDCTEGGAVCRAAASLWPTWVSPGGNRLVGMQSLEALAEASGCLY